MNGSANDPEIRERIALSIWKGLVDASVALMEGSEIAQRFDVAFDSDYRLRLRFISRLKQICEGDRRGVKYVQIVINRILRAFDVLPAAKKRTADATLAQLAVLLPEKKRLLVLTQLVTDERTTRRLSAYKAIKDIGDRRLESAVVQSYAKYGDEEALITLLRIGGDVSEAGNDVAKTISNLSERYHQALAIQRILVRDERLALSLAEEFPMAFIWAASRAGYFPAKPFVMTGFTEALNRARACTTSIALFEASRELPLFVWALGKLGAVAELNELAREYNITFP